jgi:hypothetical protein
VHRLLVPTLRNAAAEAPRGAFEAPSAHRRGDLADTPTLATLRALTTSYSAFWQISGKRRLPTLQVCDRPGGIPGLCCWFVVEPPAGIEPATPSLPWNHQEPLCEPPFPQVTPDRQGRSYRFSFDQVMRSLSSEVLIIARASHTTSPRARAVHSRYPAVGSVRP